jgi:hypothetical protein
MRYCHAHWPKKTKGIKFWDYEPRMGEQKLLHALSFSSKNQEERGQMEDLGANAWIRIAIEKTIVHLGKR